MNQGGVGGGVNCTCIWKFIVRYIVHYRAKLHLAMRQQEKRILENMF